MPKIYIMKRLTHLTIPVIIFITVATLQSCTKMIGNFLQYDIPLQSGSVTVTIPPTSKTTGSITGTGSNTINIDSVIKANTGGLLGVNNIISVKLKSVSMALQNANNANNFQNFQSCFASFSSNTDATPYQLQIPNNPDTYATTLSLPVDTTAELKSYLNGTQFTYSAGGQLRNSTTGPLTCTITFSFNIHVQG